LSRKLSNQQKKRNSNRNNRRFMVGRGHTYDPKLDAALTYLDLYSRTLIETNDHLADYIDKCMEDLLPAYTSNNLSESLSQIQNYLNGKVSELEDNMFSSHDEAKALCQGVGLDSKHCVTALFALCMYNLVERELRHMAFENKMGGSPFGKKRKVLRKVAQGAAGVAAGWGAAGMVSAGGVCAAGGGAAACALAMSAPVAIGAGVGYAAYHGAYHAVNGIYVASVAVYRGGHRLVRGVGEACVDFANGFRDHWFIGDPFDDANPAAQAANDRNPTISMPGTDGAWVRNWRQRIGRRLMRGAPAAAVPAVVFHAPAAAAHAAAPAGQYPEFSDLTDQQRQMVRDLIQQTGMTVALAIETLVDNNWQPQGGSRRRSSMIRSKKN